jgi:SAM-dependent methyltransferase
MDPRTFWDDKFGPDRFAYGTAPNAFLAAHVQAIPAQGTVLALGEGEGRNAVFLAELGFRVTAVDASPRGLQKLAQLAASRGVAVEATLQDLAAFELGDGLWDGIYNIYCHLPPALRTEIYARIQRALRPGGVFLTEQFAKDQLKFKSGGPKDENLLLSLDEFEDAFAGYEVTYAAAEKTTLDEGPLHQGPASVIRFIARKPALG